MADTTKRLGKDKFVNWMQENATDKSQGKCAKYCRLGLEAGGLDTKDRPRDGGDYGPFLVALGAEVVSGTDYKKGDMAVFGKNAQHKYGHIQVYDGSQWISDVKQSKCLAVQYGHSPEHGLSVSRQAVAG